jgi:hypothetical protein
MTEEKTVTGPLQEAIKEQHVGVIRVSTEMIRHLLLLPDDYEVTGMHIDSLTNELRVHVRNPKLPPVQEFQQWTVVQPLYSAKHVDGVRSALFVSDIRILPYPVRSHEEFIAQL